MAKFKTGSHALIERNGKYLMVEEGKDHVHGKWNLPGGGMEHGENPLENVEREVYEETGLKVSKVNGLIAVLNGNSSRDGFPTTVFVFSLEVEEGQPEPVFDQEILDAEFKTREEIEELELRNDIFIKAVEQNKNQNLPIESISDYKH